ncbi:MAG: ferredoxin [Nitrospirae bacterium]|nr:ferredoxin [Nitrospirota bacterium]
MARKVSIKIDTKKCVGCGACTSRASEVFSIKGEKSSVSYPIQDEDVRLTRAAENCPNEAIILRIISRW